VSGRRAGLATLLVAIAATLALAAPPAGAQFLGLQILPPPPPPPPPIPPVAESLTRDPDGGVVRGTAILVHAGGWAGHDANAQQMLFERPGDIFLERGWRVVSIDYEQGSAGLQDVLSAAGAELARGTGRGPLCLYGESAGGHLALVAAARLRAIDCVVALGTPTDLALYESEGPNSDNDQVRVVASRIASFFGPGPAELASWSPLTAAPTMRADVLLVDEADDDYVSPEHARRFIAARPTTQSVTLEAGDPADPSTAFIHGTVSAAGRAAYGAAIGAFADRLVAANDAERDADGLDCPRTNRTTREVTLPAIQSSLACLARRDAAARRPLDPDWRRTSVRMRGEVDSARIWARLRATVAGRRALAALARRRAALAVDQGDRSRATLRLTR